MEKESINEENKSAIPSESKTTAAAYDNGTNNPCPLRSGLAAMFFLANFEFDQGHSLKLLEGMSISKQW